MVEPEPNGTRERQSAWVRALILVAFAAPAFVLLSLGAPALFSSASAPASAVLEVAGAAAWCALVIARRPRSLWLDLGGVLLARVGFVTLLLAAAFAALVAASELGNATIGALSLALAVFAAAAFARALSVARSAALARAALVAINLVLLVALDVFVRAVVLPKKSHNNLFVEHDANLGWKLRPSFSITNQNDLFTAHETINSQGFRTRELPFEKAPGVRRLVILGDSHSEAYTVDDERTWCVELERLLSARSKVEVISLGVGGYSTDQELLSYVHYGRLYHPDVVLLQTCENDVAFNVLDHYWRGKKPLFARHGEQLFLSGVPVPDLRGSGLFSPKLLEHSAIAVLAESILRQVAIDREVEVEADLDEAWHVTDLLIRDLAQLVRSDGAIFVAFDVSSRKTDYDARFRAIFAAHQVPALEVEPMYVDDYKSYFYEGHWNPKGQKAAAELFARQLAPYFDGGATAVEAVAPAEH